MEQEASGGVSHAGVLRKKKLVRDLFHILQYICEICVIYSDMYEISFIHCDVYEMRFLSYIVMYVRGGDSRYGIQETDRRYGIRKMEEAIRITDI